MTGVQTCALPIYERFSQGMKINQRVKNSITPFWLAGMSADYFLGREIEAKAVVI